MRKKGNQTGGAPATTQVVYIMGGTGAVQRTIAAAEAPKKGKKVTAKIPQKPVETPVAEPAPAAEVPIAEMSLADKLAQPISVLDLDLRVYNKLAFRGYQTIGMLTERAAGDLYVRHTFSERSIAEVRAKLAAIGLTLKGETLPEA